MHGSDPAALWRNEEIKTEFREYYGQRVDGGCRLVLLENPLKSKNVHTKSRKPRKHENTKTRNARKLKDPFVVFAFSCFS